MPNNQDLFNCCIELIEAFTLACQFIKKKEQLYIKDGIKPITNFNVAITNPTDNENYYTIDFIVLFCLCSSDKTEALVENIPYYTRKISNESNVTEEIFLKFISLLLKNREVTYVRNAIYDDIEYNPNINMGMIPVITLEDDITFVLPFNDLRYMDIIMDASNRAVFKDYSILSIAKENGYSVNNNVTCKFSNEVDYLNYLAQKVHNKIGSLDFNELIDYHNLMEKRKKRLRERGK